MSRVSNNIALIMLAYYTPVITQIQSGQTTRSVEEVIRGISTCLEKLAIFVSSVPSISKSEGGVASTSATSVKEEVEEKLKHLLDPNSDIIPHLASDIARILIDGKNKKDEVLSRITDYLAWSLYYSVSITTPIANGREYLVALMAYITADYLCTQLPRLQAGTEEAGGAAGQRISVAKQDMDRVMALLQQGNMCITNSLRNPLVSDENVIKFRKLIVRSIGHTTTSSYDIGRTMRFHPVMRGTDIVNLIKQSKLQDAYFKLVSTEPDVVMSVYDEVKSAYNQLCG